MNKATEPSLFLTAVISFETDIVRDLLLAKADPDQIDCRGWTALHHAAANDDVPTLKVLLDGGANVAAITPDCQISRLVCLGGGNNPLHIAAMSGSDQAVSLFLSHPASSSLLSRANFDGSTPRDLARIYRKTVASRLLEGGTTYCPAQSCWQQVEPETRCPVHKDAEIDQAAYELRMTARIRNANSFSQPAPATLASFPVIGTPAVVAAAAAAAAEQEAAFRTLLAEAEADATEGPCCESETWKQLSRWLATHDVNAELGSSGDTPLHVACVLDAPAVASFLLQRGANPNSRHRLALTVPLLFCSEFGQEDCVKALLNTPGLDAGCTTRDSKVVMGQAVAVYTCGGRTALHVAACSAHLSVIRLLLDRVDPRALDNSGLSALDLIMEKIALLSPSVPFRQDLLEAASVLSGALGHDVPPVPPADLVQQLQASRQLQLVSRVQTTEREAALIARETGLARIREHYKPLHSSPYGPLPPQDSKLAYHEPVPGVQVIPLLAPSFCAEVWAEVLHYADTARARPLLPLHTRHDGNIANLQDCGFAPLLDQIMELVRPLTDALYPELGELWCFHAFMTRNFVGRDEVFRTHRDQASLTVNVCLHKTSNTEGSTVSFFSAESDPEIPTKETYCHSHSVGTAVIHDGTQWHRVNPILKGERGSLIIWARPVDEAKLKKRGREIEAGDYV